MSQIHTLRGSVLGGDVVIENNKKVGWVQGCPEMGARIFVAERSWTRSRCSLRIKPRHVASTLNFGTARRSASRQEHKVDPIFFQTLSISITSIYQKIQYSIVYHRIHSRAAEGTGGGCGAWSLSIVLVPDTSSLPDDESSI